MCVYVNRLLVMDAQVSMRVAFELLAQLGVTTDDFLAVLGRPQWLQRGRLEIVREAIDAYLQGRFAAAIHILIRSLRAPYEIGYGRPSALRLRFAAGECDPKPST